MAVLISCSVSLPLLRSRLNAPASFSLKLSKAKERLHLLKGLEKILLDIDKAIKIVRETEEESQVVDAIRQNCNVKVICIVGHNEETDKNYIKALEYVENKLTEMDECQFYKGSLKDNDVIETEQSVVILGDVNPGSAVMAGGNIIVLGGLYGEAYAGGNGKEGACVVALEMEPERLKIGDFKYKTAEKSKWSIKLKVQPKIAHVKNNKIIFDPLTKELLDSF